MTIKEAWEHLEEAQSHLERFIEAHGGLFDADAGDFNFPIPSQAAEFVGLVAATRLIGDAQGYIEDLIQERAT